MLKQLTLVLFLLKIVNGLEDFSYTHDHERIISKINSSNIGKLEEKRSEYGVNLYSNRNEENARRFLQKHRSLNPVVILVDSTRRNQDDAFNFITNIYKLSPKAENINFMLMKFNTSGVTGVLETTKQDKSHFLSLLQDNIEEPSSYLGSENWNKSVAFFSILNAANLLPPNSAIVVFSKRGSQDEDIARVAFNEVTKKRLRIYVIWGGNTMNLNDAAILKEIAIESGGDFLNSKPNDLSEQYLADFLENNGVTNKISTILSVKNLRNERNLHFPIDSDVTGIHISITPYITRGILTTPRGIKIDVLESENVVQYAPGSFVKRDQGNGIHEIHLNTTTASSRDIGLWNFRVNNAHTAYNVAIFAHSKLTASAKIIAKNATASNNHGNQKLMKLELAGDITLISNITFTDKHGNALKNIVKLNPQDFQTHFTENIEDLSSNSNNKQLELEIETLPSKEDFYAVINGKDSNGKDFTRLSYVRNAISNDIFQMPIITIDVGMASELITEANRQPQIFFEVTNNGNSVSMIQFYCTDEKYLLLRMEPRIKWLSPQETTTVVLTLNTRPGSYQDVITFSAVGAQKFEKRVIVDVGLTSRAEDRYDPELSYQYTSDCSKVAFSSCDGGTWTAEIRARDTDSGLLQVSSKPKGLSFPNGFITGTRDQIVGYYSESCCNPDLLLIAVDRANNRRVLNINAFYAPLSPAAIAAIVLGVILLLIIIIVIIVLILRKTICKDKESYDLPTYRGPNRTSSRF